MRLCNSDFFFSSARQTHNCEEKSELHIYISVLSLNLIFSPAFLYLTILRWKKKKERKKKVRIVSHKLPFFFYSVAETGFHIYFLD